MYNRRRGYSSHSSGADLWLVGGTLAACAAIVFAATYENPEARARKPEVIEHILEASKERCGLTRDFGEASYDYRLRQTLSEAYTSDLEAIEAAGIQICLDERLDDQHVGFFNHRVTGIYYPQERILTVFDLEDGIDNIFSNVGLYGERVPGEFVDDVLDKGLPLDQMYVSYKYTVSTGKSSSTHIKFRPEDSVQDEMSSNPQLRTVPVIPAPPRPSGA